VCVCSVPRIYKATKGWGKLNFQLFVINVNIHLLYFVNVCSEINTILSCCVCGTFKHVPNITLIAIALSCKCNEGIWINFYIFVTLNLRLK